MTNCAKKIAGLLVILFMFLGINSFAQNTSVGFRLGPTLYKIGNPDYTKKPGYSIGAFYTHSILQHFGITAELAFSRQSAYLMSSAEENKVKLNYLQAAILPTYFFRGGELPRTIVPKVFLGPQVSYLAEANVQNATGQEGMVTSRYASMDAGLTAGAGIHMRVGAKKWFYMDVRYTQGFIDVEKTKSGSQRSAGLGLNLGMSFPLGDY